MVKDFDPFRTPSTYGASGKDRDGSRGSRTHDSPGMGNASREDMRSLLFCLLFCMSAIAEEVSVEPPSQEKPFARHEVVGTFANGSLNSDVFSYRAGGRYFVTLIPQVQVGILLDAEGVKTADAEVLGTFILGGVTFNFDTSQGLQKALFISVGAGVRTVQILPKPAEVKFAYGMELGKRFQLYEKFIYRPSFSMLQVSGSPLTFGANLLSFAVVF